MKWILIALVIAIATAVAIVLFLREDWRSQVIGGMADMWEGIDHKEIKRMLRRFWRWLRVSIVLLRRKAGALLVLLRRLLPKIWGKLVKGAAAVGLLGLFLKTVIEGIRIEWVLLLLWSGIMGILGVTGLFLDNMLLALGSIGGEILWLLLSIRFVGPASHGVLIRLRKPVRPLWSGLNLCLPWPIDRIREFPTRVFALDLPGREMLVGGGHYPSQGARREWHDPARVGVDATVYIQLPEPDEREDGEYKLIRAYRALLHDLPEDFSALLLLEFFEDAIVDAVKGAIGETNWMEANIARADLREKVVKRLEGDSLFTRTGMKIVRVTFEEFDLPPELVQVLTLREQAEREKDQARIRGEGRGQEKAASIREFVKGLWPGS